MNEYGQPVTKGSALETRMAARGSAFGRRSKPPDLPSKLLDARIVYIGMPVRAAALLCPCLKAGCCQMQPVPANCHAHQQMLTPSDPRADTLRSTPGTTRQLCAAASDFAQVESVRVLLSITHPMLPQMASADSS